MKILVTGGLGFVGSNLVDILVKERNEVYVIDNLSSESASLKYANEFAEYLLGDVQNVVTHYHDFKFDKIFHLAAMARIQPSFEKPLEYFDSNTMGTAAVCELARLHNATLVYATTSSKNHGTPYLTPYTYSKVAGEGILKTYVECFDIDASMCTFYNVYGPREPRKGEWATVVAKFGRQSEEGESITVVGDGMQTRDFTHVEDICKGLIAASNSKRKGDNFDLGRGMPISILEVALLWAGHDKTKIEFVPLRKNEGQHTLCDTVETYAKLGWKAEYTLSNYILSQKSTYNN